MQNRKIFKTYDEQILILKSRGIIIDDETEAKNFLELNNYYNVINGYKHPFLKNSTTDDYLQNVHFSDIVYLFNADKQISHLFLAEIIRIERMIKSIIAYQFSKNYGNDYVYVLRTNFNPDPQLTNQIIDFTTSLGKTRSLCLTKRHDNRIIHYDQNGYLPLWVFINVISLGDTSKFFNYMKPDDRDAVCISLSNIFNRYVNSNETQNCLKTITFIRNICAHDQRLYNYTTKLTLSPSNPFASKMKNRSVSGLLNALGAISNFCTQNQFDNFYKQFCDILTKLLSNYKNKDLLNRIIKELHIRPILPDLKIK